MSYVSHSLRGPINAVHGSARKISSHAIRSSLAGVLEQVHRIEELSGEMRASVAKAMEVARLDAATPPIERATLDLADALSSAIRLARLTAAQVHDELHIEKDLTPAPVLGDRLFIVNGLVCLVSNAIAFAGLNGPISCSTGVDAMGASYAEVVDRGPGVTDGILKAAAQPGSSRALLTAAPGIYGFGLFAARCVCDLHV
jgi:K+-sensing histidine kinase KdpD